MRRYLVLSVVGLSLFVGTLSAQPESFVICYNPSAPLRELAVYDIIVVDFAYPAAFVSKLTKARKLVLGYLSLGKVHKTRSFVREIQKFGINTVQDQAFPDSYRVDVTNPNWHKLVVNVIIPSMRKAGFNGVFLDDLDDIGTRNQQQDAAALIASIRKFHPDIRLMANRGLEFLPDFAAHIDYVLLESCFVLGGKLRPEGDPAWALGKLAAGEQVNPKLKGFAVDYYAPKGGIPLNNDQKQFIAKVRALHKEKELLSCVTTEDLQSMPPPFFNVQSSKKNNQRGKRNQR